MPSDIAQDLRSRADEVRSSWWCIPLREGTQAIDWRDRAMRDIELIEAAAQVIEELRAALREAHRVALDASEERDRDSYRAGDRT
jgi:uncharacterized membrane protein YccC